MKRRNDSDDWDVFFCNAKLDIILYFLFILIRLRLFYLVPQHVYLAE